ncbi:MAG: DUF3108 domain-containing protein [Bdellovibrionales bacterium]|nr:DUF3108 domain-containing protein [Bdellovibrionales bacterium]
MMLKFIARRRWVLYACAVLSACSTSSLRKFDEGDLGKEISPDVATQFEIKEIDDPSATPSPAPAPSASKEKAKRKNKAKSLVEPVVKVPMIRRIEPMPFQVGECLSYDLRYLGVTAATFQTEILPLKQIGDRKVYPLRAKAKTLSFFELVYRVNDTIESFWDFDGFFSHRFTMNLDESKQTRKVIELYDQEKNKSMYWNRVDHVEKGFKEQKENYTIKPFSQDPLSALFFLRVAPLPDAPGGEYRMPFVMDGKPWESVIRYLRTETIYAGGKNRDARVYELANYEQGELKNRDNTVWISVDEHRYLLRVETKLKVGSFAVALDKIL